MSGGVKKDDRSWHGKTPNQRRVSGAVNAAIAAAHKKVATTRGTGTGR